MQSFQTSAHHLAQASSLSPTLTSPRLEPSNLLTRVTASEARLVSCVLPPGTKPVISTVSVHVYSLTHPQPHQLPLEAGPEVGKLLDPILDDLLSPLLTSLTEHQQGLQAVQLGGLQVRIQLLDEEAQGLGGQARVGDGLPQSLLQLLLGDTSHYSGGRSEVNREVASETLKMMG